MLGAVGIGKAILGFVQGVPAFAGLLKKAAKTGRIEPTEALEALTNFSPGFRRCANTATDVVARGGNISDVARALGDMGEIEVLGQRINPATLSRDLRTTGGYGNVIADVLDGLFAQNPRDIINFGEQAAQVKNWTNY